MRATFKSPKRSPISSVILLGVLCALGLLFVNPTASAQTESEFAAQAESAYRAAQQNYSTNAANFNATLDLARTAFDYAEYAKSNDARESIALVGISAAHSAIRLDGSSSAAHYYLALNLGQLARTKMLSALKMITEMEREFKRAIELDPKYDYAGAMRALGMLYMEAPGWPTSIGNKTKARTLMERAAELAPTYPDNRLTYMEGLIKWRDWKTLNDQIDAYQAALPAAKKEFTGTQWADEWSDWNPRWQAIQAKRK